MNYKLKYLKYKNKYLTLKGGSEFINKLDTQNSIIENQNINITDPNLWKYNIIYTNYEIVIYGEHHSNHDYNQFIENLKTFLSSNLDKKYVIVLEISEHTLENIESSTSLDSQKSISYLLGKSFKKNEFIDLPNVTFICGDNRTEIFDRVLHRLEDNIYKFPENYLEYTASSETDERLLDLRSIILYWEDEMKLFIGEEYEYYSKTLINLFDELQNEMVQFKKLGFLLDTIWFIWTRISNIWALNKIKNYINTDYNIIFITGQLHFFDYVYLINKDHRSHLHFICNKYQVTNNDLAFLFREAPYFNHANDEWYEKKCRSLSYE
jgi:hypothetical protein